MDQKDIKNENIDKEPICDRSVQSRQCGFAIDEIKEGDHVDSHKEYPLDKILAHKIWGFPIFLFIMWFIFQATFTVGAYPSAWIQAGIDYIIELLTRVMSDGTFKDLLINGVIQGVGGIIVFLPNILILFLFISLMETTGYLARTALIMDRLMTKVGLQGRSFVPLLIGFGCNVPAIIAARDLSNRKERLLTMLIIPFMSCSARLPVYVLLISAFFPHYQGLVLISIYMIGMIIGALSAAVINKIMFRNIKRSAPIALPRYTMPTVGLLLREMWNKGKEYVSKVGTLIVVASIIIWFLGYYPRGGENISSSQQLSQSYIGKVGHIIEPVIAPLGFDWQIGVGLVTGVVAKEMVVSTLAVLSNADDESSRVTVDGAIGDDGVGDVFCDGVSVGDGGIVNDDGVVGAEVADRVGAAEVVGGVTKSDTKKLSEEVSTEKLTENLPHNLQKQEYTSGARRGEKVFSPLVAYTLMLFILLYFPCVAVLNSLKREVGLRWAVFSVFYSTLLAWIVSFVVYQVGSLF